MPSLSTGAELQAVHGVVLGGHDDHGADDDRLAIAAPSSGLFHPAFSAVGFGNPSTKPGPVVRAVVGGPVDTR